MGDGKEYGVGYGRPPRGTRFKKGVSGNPAGRPPRHLSDMVTRIIDAPVSATKGGVPRTFSGFEAGLRKLIARAVKADDPKALLEVLRLFEEYGVLKPAPPPSAAGGVIVVPKHWDREEWLEMFSRHGAPPWPGTRSGLTSEQEQQLRLNKQGRPQ